MHLVETKNAPRWEKNCTWLKQKMHFVEKVFVQVIKLSSTRWFLFFQVLKNVRSGDKMFFQVGNFFLMYRLWSKICRTFLAGFIEWNEKSPNYSKSQDISKIFQRKKKSTKLKENPMFNPKVRIQQSFKKILKFSKIQESSRFQMVGKFNKLLIRILKTAIFTTKTNTISFENVETQQI